MFSASYFFSISQYKKYYLFAAISILLYLIVNFDINAYAFDEYPHRLSHDWGGLSICFIVFYLCNYFPNITLLSIFSFFDNYSYPIYIVHGAIVVEVITHQNFSMSQSALIILALVLIIVFAMLLKYATIRTANYLK